MSASVHLALVPEATAVDDFAVHLRSQGRSETTAVKRRRLLLAFERWLAPRPLNVATAGHVTEWLDSLPLTPASRNQYIGQLASFYTWALEEGLVDVDPTRRLARNHPPPGRASATATTTHVGRVPVIPPPGPGKPDLATVGGRATHFADALQRRELHPRTIRQYVRAVVNADTWCTTVGYSLRNVPGAVFAQYVEARPKTHATRILLRVAVTHYWQVFKRRNPPMWIIRVPKKARMVCKALTEEEAVTLAEAAKARGDLKGLAVLIAMYQGFRREEISAVRWDDLTEDGWITVMGKGSQPATLPLHPVVAEALAALPHRDEVWVFPGRPRRGNQPPVAPATIWGWVGEVATSAGLENVTTHRLRHTALATANDATGDLRAVQDYARHSKVDTTVGYTRTTERRLRAVMASIRYEHGATARYEAEQRIAATLAGLSGEDLAWIEAAVLELASDPK